jgi:GNAT superfamily N-acetyltransferase
MKIRKARPADALVISDFNRRLAMETESLSLDPATVKHGVRALFKDPAKGIYFVAEECGAVIGQVLVTTEWSDWRNGNFWWIQSVYVAHDHRREGVFGALFEHIQQLAKSKRAVCGLRLYVEADNRRAQRVYERFGMNRTHYKIYETTFRQTPRLPRA